MNIQLYQKNVPPPINLTLSFPGNYSSIILTWNEVREIYINQKAINIMYNVYKSSSQNGIYYKINNTPLKINRFEDKNISINPTNNNWYKVSTVYETEEGSLIEGRTSIPTCYRVHNTDKWFHKINERDLWILKNTGENFLYYKRLYITDVENNPHLLCPRCYDSIRGRSGTNDCPICYGTGVKGGYEPPVIMLIRLKPVEQALNIGPNMLTTQNNPGAWTINETVIRNRDVLQRQSTGEMFQVLNSMQNQVAGYLFHQELNLRSYDVTDPIYQLQRTTLYNQEINENSPL